MKGPLYIYSLVSRYQTGTENAQRKLNAKEYYESEIIRKEIKVPRSKIISNGLYGQKSKIIMRLLWSKLMKSKKTFLVPRVHTEFGNKILVKPKEMFQCI